MTSAIANAVIAKFKDYGDAYVLLGDIAAMKDDGGDAAMWYQQRYDYGSKES